jgi:hypothetical protein
MLLGPPTHEEVWAVVWRAADDATWVDVDRDGETDVATRVISLDERLKFNPTKLAEVWVHELMHVAFHYWRQGRPRAFGDKLEELAVSAAAPVLSLGLAQTAPRTRS